MYSVEWTIGLLLTVLFVGTDVAGSFRLCACFPHP